MLRIGLTGELGSGKSTVAGLLAAHGAIILSSDKMARAMQQPGERVYQAIVKRFGLAVVLDNGQLNRPALARLAFDPEQPRVEELNSLIHPAVIAEQELQIAEIARTQPEAVVVVESALIFTTRHAGTDEPWQTRFDQVVLVTAPDAAKVRRYAARVAAGRELPPEQQAELELEAKRRLAAQRIPARYEAACLLVRNDGDTAALGRQVEDLWKRLQVLARGQTQANA